MTTITNAATAADPRPVIRVTARDDLQQLPGGRYLFLSASVPYEFVESNVDLGPGETVENLNARFWATRQPARVRDAVSALTRTAIGRGFRLVFGAHPSISPMVLQAASDMEAPPASVVIFQSEKYDGVIPQSTLDLAAWKSGLLVMTQKQNEPPGTTRNPNSLAFMREMMTSVRGLEGAVFVGGMKGIALEAKAFEDRQPGARRYAIGSTGSAAAELARLKPDEFHGTLGRQDASLLETSASYSLVAHKIVKDLMQGSRA